MRHVLFISSRNRLRSPIAEHLFAGPDVETDSAGLAPDADCLLSAEQVEWADLIFVMEKQHRTRLTQRFAAALKQTRKQEFLAHMEYVVPWAALVELVALYAPEGKKERQPFAVQTMTAHPTEKASAGHQHRERAVVTMAVLDLEVSAGVRP